MRSLLFVETHPKHLHISPSCDCRWKHVFNTFAFAISVWFICWETHTYLCIIYIHSGNTRAYLCFYWLMKRRHMRVPLFSGLFYWIYSRVSRCSFSHPSTLGQPLFSPGNTASVICSARLYKEKKAYRPRDSVPAVKVFQTSCDKKELQKLKSCNVALCATAVPGSAMLSRI